MFLIKRSAAPESFLPAEPPQLDPSVRRRGAVEALNLIARSVADAGSAARQEVEPGQPDNFLAGQFMAWGQVMVASSASGTCCNSN